VAELTDLVKQTRVDSVMLAYTDLEPAFENWLSTLVDTLNSNMDTIETILASLDARITALE
jgi:hypothetical protein